MARDAADNRAAAGAAAARAGCLASPHGVPAAQVASMGQDVRDAVGTTLLELTLRELFTWRFMQTDPNWGNFLFDAPAGRLHLIDFGAAPRRPQACAPPPRRQCASTPSLKSSPLTWPSMRCRETVTSASVRRRCAHVLCRRGCSGGDCPVLSRSPAVACCCVEVHLKPSRWERVGEAASFQLSLRAPHAPPRLSRGQLTARPGDWARQAPRASSPSPSWTTTCAWCARAPRRTVTRSSCAPCAWASSPVRAGRTSAGAVGVAAAVRPSQHSCLSAPCQTVLKPV
jgi:hypothetical protein